MKCKAVVHLYHIDGEKITVEVAGQTPDKVAHVANMIKKRLQLQSDTHIVEVREKAWYNLMRDFFHITR